MATISELPWAVSSVEIFYFSYRKTISPDNSDMIAIREGNGHVHLSANNHKVKCIWELQGDEIVVPDNVDLPATVSGPSVPAASDKELSDLALTVLSGIEWKQAVMAALPALQQQ